MTYEFNDDEAETMWVFGNYTVLVSLLMGLVGVIGIFSLILSDHDNVRTFVLLMEFIFLIVIAAILFRPSDNFRNIATSEGRDIQELMRGIDEFSLAFAVTAVLIAVIGMLNFLLILSKI